MQATMRGLRRNQGEKVIMAAALENAETVTGPFINDPEPNMAYLQVGECPSSYPPHLRSHFAKVHIMGCTPTLRLGGDYFLTVELTHYEIAELFYKTHHGEMVRMMRSFIEEEQRRAASTIVSAARDYSRSQGDRHPPAETTT